VPSISNSTFSKANAFMRPSAVIEHPKLDMRLVSGVVGD